MTDDNDGPKLVEDLEKLSLQAAAETVSGRGGVCATKQANSIVLVLNGNDVTFSAPLPATCRIDLTPEAAAWLAGQLMFLVGAFKNGAR